MLVKKLKRSENVRKRFTKEASLLVKYENWKNMILKKIMQEVRGGKGMKQNIYISMNRCKNVTLFTQYIIN